MFLVNAAMKCNVLNISRPLIVQQLPSIINYNISNLYMLRYHAPHGIITTTETSLFLKARDFVKLGSSV